MAAREKRMPDPQLFISRLEGLKSKYPKVYPQDFVFGCEEGWYDILDELSMHIARDIADAADREIEPPEVYKIDEHQGSLRIIILDASLNLIDASKRAEIKSKQVCEVCGGHGKIVSINGWMKTRCKRHGNAEAEHTKRRN